MPHVNIHLNTHEIAKSNIKFLRVPVANKLTKIREIIPITRMKPGYVIDKTKAPSVRKASAPD